MTNDEALKIITVFQLNYPDNFRGKSDLVIKATVELWEKMFADEPYALVNAAVIAHMATDTSRFMPPIGVIKEAVRKLQQPEEMTQQEAWNIVAKALRNSAYGSEDEFQKLPSQIKRVVGSPRQLREWALMDTDTVQSVVASNFQRSFKAIQSREQEFQKLPSGVRQYMAELTREVFKPLPDTAENGGQG